VIDDGAAADSSVERADVTANAARLCQHAAGQVHEHLREVTSRPGRARLLQRMRRLVSPRSSRGWYQRLQLLALLRDTLDDLSRSLDAGHDADAQVALLASRIEREISLWSVNRPPTEELLWQLTADAQSLAIQVADEGCLSERLARELASTPEARPLFGQPLWADLFGEDAATTLRQALTAGGVDWARERCRFVELIRARARAAREQRANESVRAERLQFTGRLTLLAALGTATSLALTVGWQGSAAGVGYLLLRSALALLSGGLGGAVGGVLALRDTPVGPLETGRYRRRFVVQLALSAGLGVAAMILVEMGALPRIGNGGDPAMVATYALLAGWSEPFVLGVMRSLAPSGERSDPGR
jgi:hypothetical protein